MQDKKYKEIFIIGLLIAWKKEVFMKIMNIELKFHIALLRLELNKTNFTKINKKSSFFYTVFLIGDKTFNIFVVFAVLLFSTLVRPSAWIFL